MVSSPKLLLGIFLALFGSAVLADLKKAEKYEKAGSFRLAAAEYYKVAQTSTKPEEKITAEYNLARSLANLKLLYSATHYFSQIVTNNASTNTYNKQALTNIVKIDNKFPLGHAHALALFKKGLDFKTVPKGLQEFYFYYHGKELFNTSQWIQAKEFFLKVSSTSGLYAKALFHLGIIAGLSGEPQKAVGYFEKVIEEADNTGNADSLKESSNINIARVYYEAKDYIKSISYYAKIPRDSDNWLVALFEAAWAFFMIEKPKSTLGNIHTLHSPFFENRFFPETYVLQAVTYLRLCRFEKVKEAVDEFKKKYTPVMADLAGFLNDSREKPAKFFDIIKEYRSGNLRNYKNAWSVIDALSRVDQVKQGMAIAKVVDVEMARLESMPAYWQSSGLTGALKGILIEKRTSTINDVGANIQKQGLGFSTYLRDLSEQTKLITAEVLLGKLDTLRRQLNIKTVSKKEDFIGGMQTLVVGQKLEFWPFEGEYWEDELGGYVYNIASFCKK